MPLTLIQTGRKVKIINMDSGCGLLGKLASMGLVPGEEVEVIQNTGFGPFILSVKGSRIMLGRGMARKINVV